MRMDQATLDDPAAIAAVDESDMLGAVGGLGRQLRQGFHAGLAVPGLPSAASLHSVVVCGMGGSGIAGDVARSPEISCSDHFESPRGARPAAGAQLDYL